jgi:gamma-glutamylcyclotransferase (GGCT)/AIG2-like uncharacterized protein YtfP
MLNRVFVYGTLKPGGRNYHLAKGVTHAEPAYLDGFELLHFEPEGYPAIVPGSGRVYGVVLTFADIALALPPLDVLEGLHLSPPEYARVGVTARPSGKTVWTYVYVNQLRLAASGISRVAGGDWPLE